MSDAERQKHKHLRQWICHQCEADTGIPMSLITEVRVAPFINLATGKIDRRLGLKTAVCAMCIGRGKITKVE